MRQIGFSLIEMMIALVLGMIVVGASLGVYISSFGANSSQMKYSRLNNDLRYVMTQVTRDIRRAGYNQNIDVNPDTTSYSPSPVLSPSETAATAITGIAYYVDAAVESIGYKYEVVNPSASGCTNSGSGVGVICATGDGGATWTRLTDPSVIRIPVNGFLISRTNQDIVGEVCARVPVYKITIRGELVKDSTVSRQIEETVRPRNNVVSGDITCS